uniref:Uncharacterized protein n=1 Tax=Podoviridae sp. ctiuS14 TaxID=2827620 RepID=A0A8S5LMF8_9CAUD|nr:MAG TPA: hypothetical protein [Podoviridae sp. ctiuS14]
MKAVLLRHQQKSFPTPRSLYNKHSFSRYVFAFGA